MNAIKMPKGEEEARTYSKLPMVDLAVHAICAKWIGDQVLIEQYPPKGNETIILPEDSKEPIFRAWVVAVGPDVNPAELKVGDTLQFQMHAVAALEDYKTALNTTTNWYFLHAKDAIACFPKELTCGKESQEEEKIHEAKFLVGSVQETILDKA